MLDPYISSESSEDEQFAPAIHHHRRERREYQQNYPPDSPLDCPAPNYSFNQGPRYPAHNFKSRQANNYNSREPANNCNSRQANNFNYNSRPANNYNSRQPACNYNSRQANSYNSRQPNNYNLRQPNNYNLRQPELCNYNSRQPAYNYNSPDPANNYNPRGNYRDNKGPRYPPSNPRIHRKQKQLKNCNNKLKQTVDDIYEHIELLKNDNNALKQNIKTLMHNIYKNKSEMRLIKNDNNKLKQKIKILFNLFNQQKQKNNSLTKENNKLRFAASALKRIAQHLQPARLSDIEWTKKLSFKQLTIRSLSVQTYRIKIQQQAKYSKLQPGKYCVEKNPSNDYKYTQTDFNTIKKFVKRNHIGNANPNIEYKKNKFLSMEKILSTRKVEECKHLPLLIGQKETYAKVNINEGVIIGQYVGNEILKNEYYDIYNSTTDELDHLTFMHGDILTLADGETVEIYIDAFAANKSSPLLYINDGRKDMRNKAGPEDEERINTEFVMVLVNGWSMVLIRTTKKIMKDASLWIHYGDDYGLALDEKSLIYDQRKKAMRSVEEIWGFYTRNNSNSDEPFDITLFDDDELQNNSNKKRRLIMDDNCNNNNSSSSPRKKQRVV